MSNTYRLILMVYLQVKSPSVKEFHNMLYNMAFAVSDARK